MIMQNNQSSDGRPDYYTRFKVWMLPFIENGPNRILDLGCGAGRLGDRLREAGKVEQIFGVEMCPTAAEEAAQIYTRVLVGDAEHVELDFATGFDYVVCGDILEHLKDPY